MRRRVCPDLTRPAGRNRRVAGQYFSGMMATRMFGSHQTASPAGSVGKTWFTSTSKPIGLYVSVADSRPETQSFSRQADKLFSRREARTFLANNPLAGDEIRRAEASCNLRFGALGRGIIYFYAGESDAHLRASRRYAKVRLRLIRRERRVVSALAKAIKKG